MALGVDSASNRNEYQGYFLEGKDGTLGLTLPPSCADCLEFWGSQYPGALRAPLEACIGTAFTTCIFSTWSLNPSAIFTDITTPPPTTKFSSSRHLRLQKSTVRSSADKVKLINKAECTENQLRRTQNTPHANPFLKIRVEQTNRKTTASDYVLSNLLFVSSKIGGKKIIRKTWAQMGGIILKWSLEKWGERKWIVLIWLKIGRLGGLLWIL